MALLHRPSNRDCSGIASEMLKPSHTNFGRLCSRIWDYRSDSLLIWVPLWAFALLLLGGFLI